MTTAQTNTCAQILNHYGFNNQREILVEECAELIQAVSKCKRNDINVSDNFIEELADVSIMIEQMLAGFDAAELVQYQVYIKHKLRRQLKRIAGKPDRGCDNCMRRDTCDKQSGYCGEYIPTSAHWIYGEFDIPHCSECGHEVMPCDVTDKCPCCGATMEED